MSSVAKLRLVPQSYDTDFKVKFLEADIGKCYRKLIIASVHVTGCGPFLLAEVHLIR